MTNQTEYDAIVGERKLIVDLGVSPETFRGASVVCANVAGVVTVKEGGRLFIPWSRVVGLYFSPEDVHMVSDFSSFGG